MKDVKLSELRGSKVLLLFVPLAFTGTWTSELGSVRDTLGEFEQLGCKVFGISTDSPFALDAWAKEQNYQFPLLSDYNKEVSPAYDSMYAELLGFKGVSKRSAYVIDSQGKVRYREVLEDARQLPNFEAIKNCLKEIS
jgi:glutaredoxin-dependent peroxiredoxin